MALKKCPKCEINYMRDDQQFCDVCLRQMKSRKRNKPVEEEERMCSECGEVLAMPGHDLCEDCYNEQKRQQELENVILTEDPDELADEELDSEE